ncbi:MULTISPECIES: hypothetical protein [Anaeromyxobacter]|uniref:hypothetical protein n=1 Tax=Anaeromyxobacter TaxID=161492 RepID=UPI001F5ADBF6|nr:MULTISPECIES: hypothetical protein [unclassified Anaeromyxobacter]
MPVGIALLTLCAAFVMTLALASRRRRRTRALPGGLDLASTADLLPAGLKHLGARLNEPLSLGLRIPAPHAGTAQKRLGQLIGLR